MDQEMTEQEKEGIEAIIYLQSLAGIEEPQEKALRGWRAMSEHDREFTLSLHKRFKEVAE